MKKKLIAAMMAGTLALSMAACAAAPAAPAAAPAASETKEEAAEEAPAEEAAAEESEAPAEGGRTIGIVSYSLDNTVIYPEIAAIIDVIQSHGDEYVLVDGKQDNVTKVQVMDELVARDDIDGIVIINVDSDLYKQSLQNAQAKGIPVAIADVPVSDELADLVVCQSISDNYNAGFDVGTAICEALGGKGNLIMWDTQVNQTMTGRWQGTMDALKNYPDVNLLYESAIMGLDIEQGNTDMQEFLQTYDEIDAIISHVDYQALGALAAMRERGITDILVGTIDGGVDICKAIKSGEVLFSCAQDMDGLGRSAAEGLYKHFNGEEVEKTILNLCPAITSENVDEWLDYYENMDYSAFGF